MGEADTVSTENGDLVTRVLHRIAATQRLPQEKVTLESTFEDLGIDSLDGINVIFAIEDEFDISIPDDAAQSIRSVREMVEGIAALVAAKAPAQP
jgi:acyl carrier protein